MVLTLLTMVHDLLSLGAALLGMTANARFALDEGGQDLVLAVGLAVDADFGPNANGEVLEDDETWENGEVSEDGKGDGVVVAG